MVPSTTVYVPDIHARKFLQFEWRPHVREARRSNLSGAVSLAYNIKRGMLKEIYAENTKYGGVMAQKL
jgi:hypothetical protein